MISSQGKNMWSKILLRNFAPLHLAQSLWCCVFRFWAKRPGSQVKTVPEPMISHLVASQLVALILCWLSPVFNILILWAATNAYATCLLVGSPRLWCCICDTLACLNTSKGKNKTRPYSVFIEQWVYLVPIVIFDLLPWWKWKNGVLEALSSCEEQTYMD